MMRSFRTRAASVAIAISLAAGMMTGCGSKKAAADASTQEQEAIGVSIAKPEVKTISSHATFVGTVEADSIVNIIPKVAGEVEEANYEVGDHVNAGDLLFRIDDSSAQIALSQANAALASAKAGVKATEASLDAQKANQKATEAAYDAQVASNEATKQQATQTMGQLDTTSDQMQVATDSAKSNVTQAANALAQARDSLNTYNKNVDDANDALDKAKDNRDDAEDAAGEAADAVDQLKSTASDLSSKLSDLKSQLSDLQSSSSSDSDADSSSSDDNSDSSEDSSDSSNQSSDNQAQIDDLNSQIADAEAQIEVNSEALSKAQSAKSQADAAFKQAYSAYESAKSAREKLDYQKSSVDSAISNAQSAYDNAQEAASLAGKQQSDYETYTKPYTKTATGAQIIGSESQVTARGAAVDAGKANINATGAQIDAGDAGVDQAAAGVASAQLALDYTKVTSPVSGTITAKNVSAHNMASQQQAAYVIESDAQDKVVFYVAEKTAKSMTVGSAATMKKDGQSYKGTITLVSDTVDDSTGLFKIEARTSDPDVDLTTGSEVTLDAVTQQAKDALTVPVNSVYYDGTQAYVYVKQGDTAKKVKVTTGLSEGDTVEITDGLTADSDVITNYSTQLRDGQKVSLRSSKKSAAGAAGTEDNTASTEASTN
ncbi:MAG: efflux RND transporter periplasmic adaptor subunit [Lachnospiraceae bacterium]|nr:efflux RND transporter periplasmic adaptor subunit [Lachnospiraceae bacterium]